MKTEMAADRKKAVHPGIEPWSLEVILFFLCVFPGDYGPLLSPPLPGARRECVVPFSNPKKEFVGI
jgi:hypothetical protein